MKPRKSTKQQSSKSPKGLRAMIAANDAGLRGNTLIGKHPLQAAELSRRDLCHGAVAAAAAFTIVPRHVLGGKADIPPSEKLSIAVIGAGCHGTRHVKALLANQSDVQVVAVCDVNAQSSDYHDFDYKDGIAGRDLARRIVESHYAEQKRAGKYKGCAAYRDFREMLEREKDIDAVVVATPDHTHAVVAMQAIKRGKHVYCEKPLTHSIYEARKLAEAARAAKVRRSSDGNRAAGHNRHPYRQEIELGWA